MLYYSNIILFDSLGSSVLQTQRVMVAINVDPEERSGIMIISTVVMLISVFRYIWIAKRHFESVTLCPLHRIAVGRCFVDIPVFRKQSVVRITAL